MSAEMSVPASIRIHFAGRSGAARLAALITVIVISTPAMTLARESFEATVAPLLEKYCATCHNPDKEKGGYDFTRLTTEASVYAQHEWAGDIIATLAAGDMPPEDAETRPSEAESALLLTWFQEAMENPDPAMLDNPGYLPAHRLNRTQYRNTLRDLVGVGMEIAETLPPDEAAEGFDHIAAVQDLSPVHLESFHAAAKYVMDLAFIAEAGSWRWEAEDLAYRERFGLQEWEKRNRLPDDVPKHEVDGGVHRIFYSGGVGCSVEARHTGVYRVSVQLQAHEVAGPVGPRLDILLDGMEAHQFGHLGNLAGRRPRTLVKNVILREGPHDFQFVFEGMGLAPGSDPKTGSLAEIANHVEIDYIEIEGPIAEDEAVAREIRDRLVIAVPGPGKTEGTAAEQCLATFAGRAWRRPLEEAEIDGLAALFRRARERGHDYEGALKLSLTAVLTSSPFLMHLERESDDGAAHRITDFELASRLSYFLWSSMPDAELFALAGENRLHLPEVLAAQVRRMLADDKAKQLAESFAPQWLGIASLFAVDRNKNQFPNFIRQREGIRRAMWDEIVLFFDGVARENRSVLDFLDADYTFANRDLSPQYDIVGLSSRGREMERVVLPAGSPRGGVLTMSGVLMSVSHPGDTNPAGRGKWVMEVLLGDPPPPPPANVEPLPRPDAVTEKLTLRERFQEHRDSADCRSCHEKIDAIGFALENFDQNGTWRDDEDGKPIDLSGRLPDGTGFSGAAELKSLLADHYRRPFLEEFSRKMMTYALRRKVEFHDRPALRDCVAALEARDFEFNALIEAIVTSYPFQWRQDPLKSDDGDVAVPAAASPSLAPVPTQYRL